MNGFNRLFFALVALLISYALVPIQISFADNGDSVKNWLEEKSTTNPNQPSNQEQKDQDEPAIGQNASQDATFLFVKAFLILIMILVLIYGFLRFLATRTIGKSSNRFLQIRASLALGNNKSLKLVKVGSSYYLLGVGDNIQLLREITSASEIEELEREYQIIFPISVPKGKWWNRLQLKLIRNNRNTQGNFEQHLSEKLEQLREQQQLVKTALTREDTEQGKGEMHE
jgi:flagellar protein FliO/FliZ